MFHHVLRRGVGLIQAAVRPVTVRPLVTSQVLLSYDQDVDSVSVFSKNKKYYVDVKNGDRGKYVKISEMSRGKRFTLMVNGADVQQFYNSLEESIGGNTQFTASNRVEYCFEREENSAGQFYRVIEKHPDGGRIHKILIPDETVSRLLEVIKDFNNFHFNPDSSSVNNSKQTPDIA